jgi:neutral ceramidase
MRQRARAFVVAEASNSTNRILFLNIDIAMGDSGVRRGILKALEEQFPGVYTESNVAVVGTHQHSGVGGYLENLLPQVTSQGFVNVRMACPPISGYCLNLIRILCSKPTKR